MNTNKTNIRRMTLGIATMAAALAASGLMSCSSENMVIDEPRDRTEIRFNVTNSRPSRATTHYGAAAEISHFTVSAWVRGKDVAASAVDFAGDASDNRKYFENEAIEKDGDGKWGFADKHSRYWPENGESLDFYAWVDYDDDGTSKGYSFSWTKDGGDNRPSIAVTTPSETSAMVDLLTTKDSDSNSNFGQTIGDSKGASHTATLSFGHALAQVDVKVKVENPKIQMQIAEVALVNVNTKGDYFFKTSNGDDSKWANQTTQDGVTEVKAATDDKMVYFSDSDGDGKSENTVELTGEDNTFMVIPGQYTTAGTIDKTDKTKTGTFFRLKCKVWNIADATDKKDNDLQIFGDGDYADLYVPATFDWKEGTRYTYTLSFGKGNAGIDSDGNPTLVLMDWNLTDMGVWETGTTTDPIEK